jgi:hypothetical protein
MPLRTGSLMLIICPPCAPSYDLEPASLQRERRDIVAEAQ